MTVQFYRIFVYFPSFTRILAPNSAMSSTLFHLRPPPLIHLRRFHRQTVASAFSSPSSRWHSSDAAQSQSQSQSQSISSPNDADRNPSTKAPKEKMSFNDSDFQKWRRKEAEILHDIEDIWYLTKDILHSNRYECGQRLSTDDQKSVVEKLLAYHSHREDKIGCGMDYIMVDHHPQFDKSRCLFVVRTDGSWIDFSYQKCLRSYIRDKYPSYAERFIKEHFKRSS